jgi:type IV secretory pathway component VirB8
LTEQSNSLLNINQELTNSLRTIDDYKNRLGQSTKWIISLAGICVLFLILKVIAIILRVKLHIKLPWIIDVIV